MNNGLLKQWGSHFGIFWHYGTFSERLFQFSKSSKFSTASFLEEFREKNFSSIEEKVFFHFRNFEIQKNVWRISWECLERKNKLKLQEYSTFELFLKSNNEKNQNKTKFFSNGILIRLPSKIETIETETKLTQNIG